MKTFPLFNLMATLLLISSSLHAQTKYQWAGKWTIETLGLDYCNIHVNNDFNKSTAIIQGSVNQKTFWVKCRVLEIPQRNAVVFLLDENADGVEKYSLEEPLLIVITKDGVFSKIVWGQIGFNNEDYTIKKAFNPTIKKTYIVDYNSTKTQLSISKKSNNGFLAKIDENTCSCSFESSHLVRCESKEKQESFFLLFYGNRAWLKMNEKQETAGL